MSNIVVYRNSRGEILCFRHAVLQALLSMEDITTEFEEDVGGYYDCRDFECKVCKRTWEEVNNE